MKIEALLETKGREVATVRPTAKLTSVVRRMKLVRIPVEFSPFRLIFGFQKLSDVKIPKSIQLGRR